MSTLRGYKKSFTLIELLVVVGLSALILGLGIPAFNRMMRGNKVEECSGSIKLAIEQAQLRAASERRYVAVVFPNGAVNDSLKSYRLGGFRLAYVTKNTSGDGGYTFAKWVDGGWKNAPDGAILSQVRTSPYTPETNGDIKGCTAKVTDALAGASELKSLSVKDDSGNALNAGTHNALIFNPYGGTAGNSKLYLLITEAVVNGDAVVYPSAGTTGGNRSANYLVLKVNNLTGRVEYGNE